MQETAEADEGYVLPETFIITIDGKEYIVSTIGGDMAEGISFDAEDGSLIISDTLLENGSQITVSMEAAEVVSE